MAKLHIMKLYDAAWKVFRFQWDEAVTARDDYKTRMKQRLGYETASDIQRHVDLALERLQANNVPNPRIMTMREFYELLALEKVLEEIACRIEANAKFSDPGSLLPTLGLSWLRDVLPLLEGQQNPGYMPLENVKKFLGMVGSAEETADHFRKLRQELIEFLERAVRMGEPIWCII